MKATHTKGEWNTDLHDGTVYDNGGLLVANCYSAMRSKETIKANAKLIVKAVNTFPLLVEALEYIIAEIEKLPSKGTMGRTITEMQCLNKAKIALQSAKD